MLLVLAMNAAADVRTNGVPIVDFLIKIAAALIAAWFTDVWHVSVVECDSEQS